MRLPLGDTYAHIHLVLLVRVHLCGLYMLGAGIWVGERVVLLPVRGGGPDTKLRARCGALCAAYRVLVSTAAILEACLNCLTCSNGFGDRC